MIYDTSIEINKQKAIERFNFLISKAKIIEIIDKKPIRSISQNSYLHLILSWYALEYGETLEYIKQEVFKKQVNSDIFKTNYINKKTEEMRVAWRSSANLNTKETTIAIDRFRNYSSKEAGIYLPQPSDLIALQYIKNEIENNKQYL